MPKLSPLPDAQLNSVKDLLARKLWEVTVVSAQTACEIATAQVFDRFIEKKRLKPYPEWRVYNLANGRILKLYKKVTGDTDIEGVAWWPDFTAHTDLRHRIIHKGATASEPEARRSYAVAKNLVSYLRTLLTSQGLRDFD